MRQPLTVMEYDVVIVGAGPGGSMAALILSRAGKRVLVLEKATFPRSKVCGYSLNPRCWPIWEKYGLIGGFNLLPHFNTTGFTLAQEGTAIIQHHFRNHCSRAVERGVLDHWLAQEAQKSGADYQFGVTVKGIANGRVTATTGDYEAPIIIGADGRNSIVGRMGQLARPSPPCRRVGWQAFLDAPSVGDHVYMNVFPEGYYGINRIDATRTNITMILFAGTKVTPGEIVRRYVPDATVDTWRSVHPVSRRPWEITDGRSWLVGDAARMLEPLTGEGIYSAIATAEMASHHILSIEKIGLEEAAANYRRQHRRFYGSRALVNSLLGWALKNSSRSTRIMNGLKRWPGLIGPIVDWVQSPSESVQVSA